MITFAHENQVTTFYRDGELVFVVVDHSLAEARELFEGAILSRSVIGICGIRIKKGDACDISLNQEAFLAGMPIPEYLEFLAQDALRQEQEALELFA